MEKEHHTADFTLSFRKSSTNPPQSKAFPHLHHGSVAQMAEQLTFNQWVLSSNLSGATILNTPLAQFG